MTVKSLYLVLSSALYFSSTERFPTPNKSRERQRERERAFRKQIVRLDERPPTDLRRKQSYPLCVLIALSMDGMNMCPIKPAFLGGRITGPFLAMAGDPWFDVFGLHVRTRILLLKYSARCLMHLLSVLCAPS